MNVIAMCLVGVCIFGEYDTSFKAFMDYRAITSTTSTQYVLQQQATSEGVLRVHNGRYMVAIGTGWGANVGDVLSVTFDTGISIEAVVGDIKQDIHTDSSNLLTVCNGYFSHDNRPIANVLEFIVDTPTNAMWMTGCVSSEVELLRGNIIKLEVMR